MELKKGVLILGMSIFIGCSSSETNSASTTITDSEPTTVDDVNSTLDGTATTNDDSNSTSDNTTNTIDLTNSGGDITNAILTNTSANCEEYVNNYISTVTDIQNDTSFNGSLEIEVEDGKCRFISNSIPNHDFNDITAHFATDVAEISLDYSVTASPTFASSVTNLALGANAVMLNGVKLDILAAGCYGIGDGNIGCNDLTSPFRYDPMSPLVSFGTDEHNAHTQPTGQYHYHGDPVALYTNEESSPIKSPVIGFAKDGFPIYGMYYEDENNVIQKTTSSFQLKTGARETVDGTNPPENEDGTFKDYDGSFRDDYEYIEGLGVLDECNGMTIDGNYGYYVTGSFPWIINCYKGTPDSSFTEVEGQGNNTGTPRQQ